MIGSCPDRSLSASASDFNLDLWQLKSASGLHEGQGQPRGAPTVSLPRERQSNTCSNRVGWNDGGNQPCGLRCPRVARLGHQ